MAATTCVFFHAHPDDEALLTAGTMARLAAEGHRVVLVVATVGERGLADSADGLGERRAAEVRASARALGCARVVFLGYRDSGLGAPVSGGGVDLEREGASVSGGVDLERADGEEGFAAADVRTAAGELAQILVQEEADLLTVYDPAGGYGHPDHVQVHRVGTRAAALAGTPIVLEATVDRDLLLRALRIVSWFHRFPAGFDRAAFERAYVRGEEITHRVKVGRYAAAKRASMAAHASQTTGGDSVRTLAALLRLPRPLFRLALGTEWYVRRDVPAGTALRHPLDRRPGGAARAPARSR